MNLTESLRIALTSLVINRLRAVLTTLGIIIGVGAVVGLTSLGRGVEQYVAQQFEDLGANTLTVSSTTPSSGTRTEVQPITDKEGEAIARLPGVEQVAMQYTVTGTLVAGTESVDIALNGVTPGYAEVNNWFPRGDGGRFINQTDLNDAARVVVLGTTTVEDLFGDPAFNPINLPVQINGRIFTIIGVMEERAAAGPFDQNEVAFIPISTAQTRLDNARVRGGAYEVSQLQVQVESEEAVEAATQAIEAYLTDAHDIVYAGDEDFSVGSQADLLSSITQVTVILTVFLGGVAGISLLVGGAQPD
jgi:putative ABC transport system permease protein